VDSIEEIVAGAAAGLLFIAGVIVWFAPSTLSFLPKLWRTWTGRNSD